MVPDIRKRDFLLLSMVGAIVFGGALIAVLDIAIHARSAVWSNVLLALGLFALSVVVALMVVTCFALVRLKQGHLKSRVVLQKLRFFLHCIYPALFWIAQVFRIDRDALQNSYIQYNNQIVDGLIEPVSPERILVLLPHCLQWSECGHKIAGTGERCAECGKCTIGSFRRMTQETGIPIVIATGGTLARKAIREHRPELVLAVACERDLAAGIYEMRKLPVFGVLNERPEGPCKNTQVDPEQIATILDRYTKK